LPPTRDALELHAARANHQAKIWLQADKEHIDVASPTETRAWKKESGGIQVVWPRLPPPHRCLSGAVGANQSARQPDAVAFERT